MEYEVTIAGRVYVRVEFGGSASARDTVRDHVANDWLLQVSEGLKMGRGHFLVKGMSAEVLEVKAFPLSGAVVKKEKEPLIEEEIF